MPLVQWLMNLEPIQSVSVRPSSGTGRDVLDSPFFTSDDIIEVPSAIIGNDVVEVPQLRRGASPGTSSIAVPKPSEAPSVVTTKPAGPAVVTSAKSLSSSSMTSKAISGKPSIRRRS